MHLRFVAAMLATMPLTGVASEPVRAVSDRLPSRVEASATTPALGWQGVSSVRVLCLVAPDSLPHRRDVQTALCDRIAALAGDGAPLAVTPMGFGDPRILDRDTVTLLVHATVEPATTGRTLIFSMRAFRNAGVETATFFGAAPRAVTLAGSAIAGPALDEAIDAALGEVVPWRQGRAR